MFFGPVTYPEPHSSSDESQGVLAPRQRMERPELRQTVLTLIAFHDLQLQRSKLADGATATTAITAFLTQNQGEGWMLPETLRLADYGLGHDERAQQSSASCEPPWAHASMTGNSSQSAEESWRECHLHARNLLGSARLRVAPGRPDGRPFDQRRRPLRCTHRPVQARPARRRRLHRRPRLIFETRNLLYDHAYWQQNRGSAPPRSLGRRGYTISLDRAVSIVEASWTTTVTAGTRALARTSPGLQRSRRYSRLSSREPRGRWATQLVRVRIAAEDQEGWRRYRP